MVDVDNARKLQLDSEKYEKEHWDSYYSELLKNKNSSISHKQWWAVADDDLNDIVRGYVPVGRKLKILEAGCGSASSSYKLSNIIDELCLVDLSSRALEFVCAGQP